MGPRLPVFLSLISISLACRRHPDPAPARDAGSAGPTRDGVPTPTATADTRDDEQRIPDGFCHPATVVSTGRGGAVIDACFDPQSDSTDLIGQRVDADAMAVGSRVRLLRIPGNVLSLASTLVGGTIRVAWISHVGDGAERSDEFSDPGGGARELAVLSLSPSLEVIGSPIRMNRYAAARRSGSERRGWARSRVEVAPGPERSMLALATDANEPCAQGGQRCSTWSVFSVDESGTSRRVRHDSTLTPSIEPQSLIVVGGDLAYLRGADAVRSSLFVHSVRAVGTAISALPSATFDPLVDWVSGSLAWTGAAVVTLGEERPLDAAEPRVVVRVTPAIGTSPTRPRASDDPEAVRWPVVTERSWRCVRRHPVVRIAWRGGSIELDPTVPGASIDLSRWVTPAMAGIPSRAGVARWNPPMAWTGRALLAIDGQDRLRRWTCPRDGALPTE